MHGWKMTDQTVMMEQSGLKIDLKFQESKEPPINPKQQYICRFKK